MDSLIACHDCDLVHFFVPANVLPITIVISLGKAQADTIMSGVIY